jgi:hypothetical protein
VFSGNSVASQLLAAVCIFSVGKLHLLLDGVPYSQSYLDIVKLEIGQGSDSLIPLQVIGIVAIHSGSHIDGSD